MSARVPFVISASGGLFACPIVCRDFAIAITIAMLAKMPKMRNSPAISWRSTTAGPSSSDPELSSPSAEQRLPVFRYVCASRWEVGGREVGN